MSRAFTGGDGDNIAGTVLPITGVWSVGCWVYTNSTADARILGSSGFTNYLGQGGTAGDKRFRLVQGWSSAFVNVETNSNALILSTWQCVVFSYGGAADGTNSRIYVGGLAAVMADAGQNIINTAGGSQSAWSASQIIGNDSGGSISWPGNIAQIFAVPWAMTLDETERFRQGDWRVLYAHGIPRFFLPLQGASLYDLSGSV